MKLLRRALVVAVALVGAVLVLPPLWFRVFPVERTAMLPPPGRRVVLPGGVGLNVLERGDGPPVVLVHGLPGNAYEWRALSDALAARGRRVIAYDRVGFGRSDPRPEGSPYTVEQNATELLGVLDALDLVDATVVGWSYGGATAIAAARRDPARIGRLVLIGSAGPGGEERRPPALVRLLMSEPGLAWLRAVPPLASGMRAAVSRVAFSDQPQPDWWLPLLDANLARDHTGRAYAGEMRGVEGQPFPGTSDVVLPIVVIHGDDDRLAPLAIGRALAERAAHGRLVVVEGGSHMLPVTHAELLADQIAGPADS